MISITVKVVLLIASIMLAYILRIYYIRPHILEPSCLIDTQNCVQLEYYNRDNSVFVIVRPSSYRLWFNGQKFFVYDVFNSGRTCADPDYEPAYEIKPTQNYVDNYTCIRSISKVFEYYKDVPKKTAYIRATDTASYSVFDVIQYLLKERIIGLK
jgi:hypothetical protein